MSYFIFFNTGLFKALYPTLCTKQKFKTNALDYFLKSGKVQGDSVNNTGVQGQKTKGEGRQTPPTPLPPACLTISDINHFQEITAEEVAELRQELEALEEVAKALLNIVGMLELLEQRVSSGRVRRDIPAPTTCDDLTSYINTIKTSKGVDALPYAIAMDTYFKGVVNEETEYISCESLKAEVKATVEKVEKAKKEVANKIPPVQKIPTAEPVDTTTAEPVDTTTAEPIDTTTVEPVDTTTAEPDDEVSNTTTAEPIDTTTAEPIDTTTAEPIDTTTAEPDDEVSNTTTAEPIDTTTADPMDTTTDVFYLFEMPVKVVYTPSAFF